MSREESQVCVSMEAGTDLSARQYRFMSLASDRQVDPTGDGARAHGVLQNDPDAAGKAATICIGGITKIEVGGAITAGGQVASGALGVGVAPATGDYILGTALETATTSGEIISMIFHPNGVA